MFENITPANWMMFAMKHYDNPQADGEEEFQEDIKRYKYLKRTSQEVSRNRCVEGEVNTKSYYSID